MIERVEELEQKVSRLIQSARAMREEIRRLREDKQALARQLEGSEKVAKEMSELRAEAAKLREQVEAGEGKEAVVRNKLKTIIDRVEDIEGELEQIEGTASV